jgi:antirestriction protein ArdC
MRSQRVTDSIVAELERGVRPWLKPWNAEHAAGRITRLLRSGYLRRQGEQGDLRRHAQCPAAN